MKTTFLSALALMALALTACSSKVSNMEDDEVEITKTLNRTGFNAINLNGSGDVEFTQGTEYKVELVATKAAMEGLTATVKGNTLVIERNNNSLKTKGGISLKIGRRGYTVRVTAPDLTSVNVMGSGEFRSKTPIRTKSLKASVIGSGDLNLNTVTAGNVSVAVSGSGDADISVLTAANVDLNVTGSGDIDARLTNCGTVNGNVTGSGDVEVKMTKCETLNATVTGSGDLEAELDDCGTVNAGAAGSGDISLKGHVRQLNVTGKNVNSSELKTGK